MNNAALSFSREIGERYGISAALLFQELLRKQHYWKEQGRLNSDGMFWCDQKAIGDWILLHPNNVGKAAKVLEEAGLIIKKVGYRPGTTTPTTWWKVVISEINETVISRNQRNSDFYIKANTKATTGGADPVVVFLRVNPSGKAWKSQRVYSTQGEVDRLEASDPDDFIDFKYWKSPKMVGNDSSAKFKRTKAKLVQPDVQEDEEEEEHRIPGGYNPWAE